MPLKLTIEVPDELVAKLDALAAHYEESREAFATQSVEFCIRQGTKVVFEDDDLSPEEWEMIEDARDEIARGETFTHEEVVRELERDLREERAQGPQEAAE